MKVKKAGRKVIYFKKKLGHDVGRAIGAKYAMGKILLFIDGDFILPGEWVYFSDEIRRREYFRE